MKEGDFSKGPACRASAGDDSIRKNRTSRGIRAVAWLASQPEEQSSAVSCRKTWACTSQHTGFCLLCHAAINPEQLHWNGGNYSRFTPVSVKRGFLLNGSGQPLAGGREKSDSAFSSCCWSLAFAKHRVTDILFLFFPFFSLPTVFFFCVSDCFARCTEKRTQFLREEGILWQDEPAWVLAVSEELVEGQITLARTSIWLLISECGVLASASRPWETNVCRREFRAWLASYFCVLGNTQLRTMRAAPSTRHTRQQSLQQSRGSCSWGLLTFPPSAVTLLRLSSKLTSQHLWPLPAPKKKKQRGGEKRVVRC